MQQNYSSVRNELSSSSLPVGAVYCCGHL